MAKDRLVYDYYTVDVPTDFGSKEERIDCAIDQAREQARLYVVPANWKVVEIDPDSSLIKVRRLRFRPEKK